ncbi:hypothetical protein GFM14_14710 [Rhizobium leguminosarum bv. viciae]|uniref:hypothetical protein n=1 Tax=Rhizobium leguminosarum TaxID=384 RepID=UPI001441B45C|nr:hypothetical protein [Rhizobium leguminosarum]NKJ92834.1 hypothetical protein [Rhizobium leguminosarum bv. viciae]NKK86689.1 hypothetical protein [Rhizobium leguminosarum bv. viciae]
MTKLDSGTDFVVADFIYDLQLEQLRHDETFHKDVVILSLADRVKHMALHNGKYVAYFFEASGTERFAAVLTDAFIITLATANTLNQDLGKAVGEEWATISRLGEVPLPQPEGHDAFIRAYAIAAGSLAKACESWDHLEMAPFNTMMRESNLSLFKLVVGYSAALKIDIVESYRARLRFIERRSIFHRTLAKVG